MDVERWLADEPVSAYQERLTERLRRWMRRNQRLVTAATAATLVALVGLVAIASIVSISNGRLATANQTIRENSRQIAQQNQDLELANTSLEQAREEAVTERNQAREVTNFLVSSFRKPDPEQDGRKITVAEVLASGVEGTGGPQDRPFDPRHDSRRGGRDLPVARHGAGVG